MSGVVADKTGKRIGHLVVLAMLPREFWRRFNAEWICACDCGELLVVSGANITGGRPQQSCGCTHVTHGHFVRGRPSSTYTVWSMMKQRCLNPKATDFKYYGERGITVCDRWRESFEAFLEDMGERPEGLTLDRVDVNGNYEPGNCRWATAAQQSANRRLRATA